MDILSIYVAYAEWESDGLSGKRRPVLIIKKREDDVLVFAITTKFEKKSENIRSKFYPLKHWDQVGLQEQSYVDTNQLYAARYAIIDKTQIGTLTEFDKQGLLEHLQNNK